MRNLKSLEKVDGCLRNCGEYSFKTTKHVQAHLDIKKASTWNLAWYRILETAEPEPPHRYDKATIALRIMATPNKPTSRMQGMIGNVTTRSGMSLCTVWVAIVTHRAEKNVAEEELPHR